MGRRSKKMCRKTEDAGETLEQDDNYAGGCQKSCHFVQVRLQREPEQPYCGICQAYVEKCVCRAPAQVARVQSTRATTLRANRGSRSLCKSYLSTKNALTNHLRDIHNG